MSNEYPSAGSLKKFLGTNRHIGELVRASSASFLLRVTAAGTGLGLYAYIGRAWGAEGVGIFSQCVMVTTVVAMLARIGLDNVLIRFVAESRASPNSPASSNVYTFATKVVLSLGLFLTLAVYLLAETIAELVSTDRNLVSALKISAVSIVPLAFVYINGFSLQGAKKISQSVFCIAVSVPLFTLAFCLLFDLFEVPNAPILSYATGTLAAFVVSYYLWVSERGNDVGTRSIGRRSILAVAYPLFVIAIAQQSVNWFSLIYLGQTSTTDQVGVFHAATKVTAAIGFVVIAINSIASPKFAELAAKGDRLQLQEVITMSLKLAMALGLPVVAIVVGFATPIMKLFGSDFGSGGLLLTIMAIGQIANIVFGQMGVLLIMTAQQRSYGLVILASAMFNVCVCLGLISRYGATGAAYAAATTVVFEACCTYAVVRKKLGLRLLSS